MYFDEKLKALREQAGLSILEAAEELDMTEAILEALETGFKDPDKIEMRKITEFYKVTEEELADDEPYVNAFSVLFENSDMSEVNLGSAFAMTAGLMGGQKIAQAQEQIPTQIKKLDNKKIPIVQSVKLEKAIPVYDYLEKCIIISDLPEGNYIACKVSDDNMLGLGIYKDDIAVIRLQKDVADNEIAAFILQDKLSLLRVKKQGGNVILETANPLIGPEMMSEEHYLLGKLVEARKYF